LDGVEEECCPQIVRVCKAHDRELRPRSRRGFARRGGRHLDDILICPVGNHRVGPGEFRVVNTKTGETVMDETGDV
jgi:hypothetical protein